MKKNINLTSIIKIQDKLTLNYTIQTQNQTNIISKLEEEKITSLKRKKRGF